MNPYQYGTRWNPELGCREKWCGGCQEWWPADEEFWYCHEGILQSPCRACVAESRERLNQTATCCVEGCNEPRKPGRYSRCEKHYRQKAAEWYAASKRRKAQAS